MSFQPQIPGLFSPENGAVAVQTEMPLAAPLPATEKQLSFARVLSAKAGVALPEGIARDRAALSKWIDAHKAPAGQGRFSNYPSSKQVAFAERIARAKRNPVPPECFRDKLLMSRWIDSNKP